MKKHIYFISYRELAYTKINNNYYTNNITSTMNFFICRLACVRLKTVVN